MPILDIFEDHHNGFTGPICGGFDVTPSDAADLPQMTRGVVVASAGDLAVVQKSGDGVTLPALSPGVIYQIRIARVLATGTTATAIKGVV